MSSAGVEAKPGPEGECCFTDNLLSVEMAVKKGVALANAVAGKETVDLFKARGRVCVDDFKASLPLPNFDNTAMDGYAINTGKLIGEGPFRLKITGTMAAGDDVALLADDANDGAIRILTGAPIPTGFDAVIMQEVCRLEGEFVSFDKRPFTGSHIRPGGEDCMPGDLLIDGGTMLAPRHIALLAAQGCGNATVRRKVRVAIFSTGSELKIPGETLAAGQIYNSNRYVLAGQLDQPFVEIVDLGTVVDDPELLKAAMEKAIAAADLVITTGGVSVGDEDHMPNIVTDLGGALHVIKVAIKPGKPVTIGTIGDTLFLGLPGNPVAAYVNQMLIGQAIIDKLAGLEPKPVAAQPAIAGFSRKRAPSRQEYVPVRIVGHNEFGAPVLKALKKAGSAALLPLAGSDGFAVLKLGVSEIGEGDTLSFIPH